MKLVFQNIKSASDLKVRRDAVQECGCVLRSVELQKGDQLVIYVKAFGDSEAKSMKELGENPLTLAASITDTTHSVDALIGKKKAEYRKKIADKKALNQKNFEISQKKRKAARAKAYAERLKQKPIRVQEAEAAAARRAKIKKDNAVRKAKAQKEIAEARKIAKAKREKEAKAAETPQANLDGNNPE